MENVVANNLPRRLLALLVATFGSLLFIIRLQVSIESNNEMQLQKTAVINNTAAVNYTIRASNNQDVPKLINFAIAGA